MRVREDACDSWLPTAQESEVGISESCHWASWGTRRRLMSASGQNCLVTWCSSRKSGECDKGRRIAVGEYDNTTHLAKAIVGFRYDCHVGDIGVAQQHILDFLYGDVLTAADDDVLCATAD